MAIFASTTLSGYNDPYRALTLKALEKRQQDLATAEANATIPKTETAIGAAGVGLGALGGVLEQRNMAAAANAKRDQLGSIMAGIDPVKGPNPQQAAALYALDSELGGKMLQNQYETGRDERKFGFEREQAAEQRKFQGAENEANRGVTRSEGAATRQNQMDLATQAQRAQAELAQAERNFKGIQAEYDRAAASGNIELKAQLEGRLQQAQQAHDMAKQNAEIAFKAGQAQSDKGKVEQDINRNIIPPDQAAAARATEVKPQTVEKRAAAETSYRGHATGIQRLEKALSILDDPRGIYTGYAQNVAPGVSGMPGGGYLVDKDKAQRTAEFNSIVNKEAIQAMSQTLKGASTDFEMRKFLDLLNNPNVSDQARKEGLISLIAAAKADKNIKRQEAMALGGNTDVIDADLMQSGKPSGAPAEPSGASGAAAGGGAGVKEVASEAEALALPPGTKFKLPDGRTGTAR